MQSERRRAPRHLLGGAVEVIDLESEKQITTSARNLSLFGCFVATTTPFVTGTKVRLRITHQGATFAALGWVAHTLPSEGMGIAFGGIEARDRAIIDTWLGEHEV
jgi:PilZ domain